MRFDKHKLIEKTTDIRIDTNKTLDELDLDFFFNYSIFPAHILIFKTEWQAENRAMKIGDTIVQQAFLPPVKYLSQKVIFGVRIKEIVNEINLKRFSYETIEGHVEKGISSFSILEDKGMLKFRIHTYSTPGNLLTRIPGPFITIPYQSYCTRQALKQVKKQLEEQ